MKSPSILFILLLLSCCLISSCSVEKESPLQEETIIMAQLKISPSIEQEELPLSRTESRAGMESGLYAINVWWKGKDPTSSYQPYASGLFNDISNVKIGLIVGYEYRFDCTFLPDSELPYSENGKYGRPFSLTKDGRVDAEVTNKLKVSINPLSENSEFHQLIYNGDTQIKADSAAQRPLNQHRYYGCGTIDFRSQTDSPTATIELKRAYYTLCFTTNKELNENDSIKIIADNTDPFYILHSSSPSYSSEKRWLTMKTISNIQAWGWDGKVNDSDPMVISAYYRSAKAAIWVPIFENYEIKPKRNKSNFLKITNIDTASQGHGDISFGDGEIGGAPADENDLNKQ